MLHDQIYEEYKEALNAAIAAGLKSGIAGSQYIDWLTSSDDPVSEEEIAQNHEHIEWIKACDEYTVAKQKSDAARTKYMETI